MSLKALSSVLKKGLIRHKPLPIQTFRNCQDRFRLSRPFQTFKTLSDCLGSCKLSPLFKKINFHMLPGSCHIVTGRRHMVPGRCYMVPGRCHMEPIRCLMVPGRCHMVLGRCHIMTTVADHCRHGCSCLFSQMIGYIRQGGHGKNQTGQAPLITDPPPSSFTTL